MTTTLLMHSLNLLAQSSNPTPGFPIIDTLIVLVGVGGAIFAVCRSANRR
ncbi:MAG: hypothetical protein KDA78_05045 [Planctomycetaceae bacterium]|nr:hypothetical protein [Planctomycetaceae bacterium]